VEVHEPTELWYTTRPWYAKAKASGLTDADGYIIRWGVWSPDTVQVWTGLPVILLPLRLLTPLVAPLDTVDLRPQIPPYRFDRTVEGQIRLRSSVFHQVLEDLRLPEHGTWIPEFVRQIAREGSQRGVVGTEPTVAGDRARVASIDRRFDAEVIEPELEVTLWLIFPPASETIQAG
jgi:hypothetical protein